MDQHVGAALGFGRGLTVDEALVRLGLAARPRTVEPWTATVDRGRPAVRVVGLDGWALACGYYTMIGADEPSIRLLSAGGEAFGLVFTATISSFLYALDGEVVSGFDVDVPSVRFGVQPRRFDSELAAAGLDHGGGGPGRPARVAAFVEAVFGVTITPEALAGPAATVMCDSSDTNS